MVTKLTMGVRMVNTFRVGQMNDRRDFGQRFAGGVGETDRQIL
jgi:hypothetical protein